MGEQQKLIQQVCKKLIKGKLPETIAEELEEDIATIKRICETAARFAPEYDCDLICKELNV